MIFRFNDIIYKLRWKFNTSKIGYWLRLIWLRVLKFILGNGGPKMYARQPLIIDGEYPLKKLNKGEFNENRLQGNGTKAIR